MISQLLRTSSIALAMTIVLRAAPMTAQSANTPDFPAEVAAGYTLIPAPRELITGAALALRRGIFVAQPARAADRATTAQLRDFFRERHIRLATTSNAVVTVTLHRVGEPDATRLIKRSGLKFDSAMTAEGYVLIASGGTVDVIGASDAGVFYGVQTLQQLVQDTGSAASFLGATIRDWPAMRWRGFQDDLSRGPIPTLAFQKKQLRTLAAYKLNVYSPYFEHSLPYDAYPLASPPGNQMSNADIAALVDYARTLHIDVIPEQEAFGHLHHLLKWETYSAMAETPHGHVLAPGQPGSMEFVRASFAEIAKRFPSQFLHIGADETFELGRGQTKERIESEGKRLGKDTREGVGAVYVDFVKKIAAELAPLHKRLLFWGDVAMNHPDLTRTLPKDMIAVAWWYDPKESYDNYLTPFRDAGIETWVAPGVNNWNRVYPNNANMLTNIRNFVRDGQRLGSTGMLNTSWDDDGEAIFNQTWYGVLFGAAAAWQPGESSIPRFEASFGRTFHGDTTGRLDDAQRKLAAAHKLLQSVGVGDASDYLFWLDPWSAEGRFVTEKTKPVLRNVRLLAEGALLDLHAARRSQPLRETDALSALELGARRTNLIGMKLQFAEEVSEMYARAYDATVNPTPGASPTRELGDITGINGRLQDLRDEYGVLRSMYEQAWMRENSSYWLNNVTARFDQSQQLWISRADKVNQARQRWYRDRTLPPATELGIPVVPVRPILPIKAVVP